LDSNNTTETYTSEEDRRKVEEIRARNKRNTRMETVAAIGIPVAVIAGLLGVSAVNKHNNPRRAEEIVARYGVEELDRIYSISSPKMHSLIGSLVDEVAGKIPLDDNRRDTLRALTLVDMDLSMELFPSFDKTIWGNHSRERVLRRIGIRGIESGIGEREAQRINRRINAVGTRMHNPERLSPREIEKNLEDLQKAQTNAFRARMEQRPRSRNR
jgi:hypothetical protein